ncbi:Imm7 family immunity protein [Hymenobacter bucti]|uniref:Imm7 family immunity protein n=1 Tax=Hymenobacter bucti TaxID=1844114 RepID=A0ABW4QYC3_9BACT
MIEFNGWVRLALSTDGEGEDHGTSTVQAIRRLADGIRGYTTFPFVQVRNGSYYLHVAGNANHNGLDWAETNELLQEVARRFPAAYGLVHLRDDEDAHGNDNAFMVYVVRRGTVECHPDSFLSPCNPIIEE